jgi:hypothetical protein
MAGKCERGTLKLKWSIRQKREPSLCSYFSNAIGDAFNVLDENEPFLLCVYYVAVGPVQGGVFLGNTWVRTQDLVLTGQILYL